MKKLCLILISLVSIHVSAQSPLFSVNADGRIVNTQARFIDPQDPHVNTLSYRLGTPISVTAGGTTWTIKTGRYVGWENDPGDFDVIEVSKGGTNTLLYKSYLGIMKIIDAPDQWYASEMAPYSRNGYFIETSLSSTSKALIFLGQNYGSDLSQLIIIVLTEMEAELVFNKPMAITRINNATDNFSLTLESKIVEVVDSDGTPTNEKSPVHTIYQQGSILYFRDNK